MVPELLQLAIQVKKDWPLTWREQFVILYRRTFRERCRDYFDKLRFIQALAVAVLLGLIWWKSKTGTEAQLRDQVNFHDTFYESTNGINFKYKSYFRRPLYLERAVIQVGLMFYICIFWTSSSIFEQYMSFHLRRSIW